MQVFRISVLNRAKELVDELVHTDITSTFKDLAESSRKTKPKAVHYDEVDLEQISLFDTVQDQDIIEELKESGYYDADADGCDEYIISVTE